MTEALRVVEVKKKDGMHPYRAGLFFVLRTQKNPRSSAQRRAALIAGNVADIADWESVRLLAHCFDKGNNEVARDLIKLLRTLEDGAAA